MESGSPQQLFVALVISFSSLGVYAYLQPYAAPSDNYLALLSQAALFVFLLSSIMLETEYEYDAVVDVFLTTTAISLPVLAILLSEEFGDLLADLSETSWSSRGAAILRPIVARLKEQAKQLLDKVTRTRTQRPIPPNGCTLCPLCSYTPAAPPNVISPQVLHSRLELPKEAQAFLLPGLVKPPMRSVGTQADGPEGSNEPSDSGRAVASSAADGSFTAVEVRCATRATVSFACPTPLVHAALVATEEEKSAESSRLGLRAMMQANVEATHELEAAAGALSPASRASACKRVRAASALSSTTPLLNRPSSMADLAVDLPARSSASPQLDEPSGEGQAQRPGLGWLDKAMADILLAEDQEAAPDALSAHGNCQRPRDMPGGLSSPGGAAHTRRHASRGSLAPLHEEASQDDATNAKVDAAHEEHAEGDDDVNEEPHWLAEAAAVLSNSGSSIGSPPWPSTGVLIASSGGRTPALTPPDTPTSSLGAGPREAVAADVSARDFTKDILALRPSAGAPPPPPPLPPAPIFAPGAAPFKRSIVKTARESTRAAASRVAERAAARVERARAARAKARAKASLVATEIAVGAMAAAARSGAAIQGALDILNAQPEARRAAATREANTARELQVQERFSQISLVSCAVASSSSLLDADDAVVNVTSTPSHAAPQELSSLDLTDEILAIRPSSRPPEPPSIAPTGGNEKPLTPVPAANNGMEWSAVAPSDVSRVPSGAKELAQADVGPITNSAMGTPPPPGFVEAIVAEVLAGATAAVIGPGQRAASKPATGTMPKGWPPAAAPAPERV